MRKKKQIPSLARVAELLELRPDGKLVWKDAAKKQLVGKYAGHLLHIDRVVYTAREIIWLLSRNGEFPANPIYLIDPTRGEHPDNLTLEQRSPMKGLSVAPQVRKKLSKAMTTYWAGLTPKEREKVRLAQSQGRRRAWVKQRQAKQQQEAVT
jgi:hypothetical protein